MILGRDTDSLFTFPSKLCLFLSQSYSKSIFQIELFVKLSNFQQTKVQNFPLLPYHIHF